MWLTLPKSIEHYPDRFRRVSYKDPESGKALVFLTNNFDLPALTIAQLYKCRWRVELFFKWLVYEELRKLAAARMAQEWETSTLQPTALVHEAWLRLAGSEQQAWKNRGHFFAAAAEAMRRILIDRARRKHARKRQAGSCRIDLERVDVAVEADEDSLLIVDEALTKLAAQDPQCAELVKLRFFGGVSYEEAAEALGISERSAYRYWTFARAWLHRELSCSSLSPAASSSSEI